MPQEKLFTPPGFDTFDRESTIAITIDTTTPASTAAVYADELPFPSITPRPFDAKELPRQKQKEERAQIEFLAASASAHNIPISPTDPIPALAAAAAAAAAGKSNTKTPSSPTALHAIFSTIMTSKQRSTDLEPSSRASSVSTVTSSSTTTVKTTELAPSSRSSSIRSFISSYEKPFSQDRDAGNRPLDHYKNKLPPFRYRWRNAILPIIRWETPILADIQKRFRNPFFDIYFALSANLGTHTCYVLMLPISFWYGHANFGRNLVFMLAFGVYITNFVKDLLCLPRPLSPPLHRLTMSGSAALEYGFPSTHTANAVSVFLLLFHNIVDSRDTFSSATSYHIAHFFNLLYVVSIVAGRIYCGMHGFLDVIGGLIVGVGLWLFSYTYGSTMEAIIFSPGYTVLFAIPMVLFLVRVHPEPADDCPCFDDGVAFMGVMAGTVVGEWHFNKTFFQLGSKTSIPFDASRVGFSGMILRFLIGSILISIWRPVIKRALHEALPPLFRYLEKGGFSMPRKFFVPASQYEDVPSSLSDSTLFEPENITSLFTKAGRARADSVGPQSTADVYESIAYREYQKQKAVNRKPVTSGSDLITNSAETVRLPVDSPTGLSTSTRLDDAMARASESEVAREMEEDELMSKITKPRVRYDVEVVTKLIVYSGIALIAVDLCGVIFVTLGI